MIKEKVEKVIFSRYVEMNLTPDKSETFAQFKKQIFDMRDELCLEFPFPETLGKRKEPKLIGIASYLLS